MEKQFVSILLAILLAVVPVLCVYAEEGAVSSPRTTEVTLEVSAEALATLIPGTDENRGKMLEAIEDMVRGLNLRIVTDGVDSEFALTCKGGLLLGGAVLQDNEKSLMVSTLFPNSVIRIPGLNPAEGNGIETSDMIRPFTRLWEEMLVKAGNAESTKETFFGTEFTSVAPVDMTMREACTLFISEIRELALSDAVKNRMEYLKKAGLKVDLSFIDEWDDKLHATPDEDLPVLRAKVYTNESGDKVVHIAFESGSTHSESSGIANTPIGIEPDGQRAAVSSSNSSARVEKFEVCAGEIGGCFTAEAHAGDQMDIEITTTSADEIMLKMDIRPAEGQKVSLEMNGKKTSDGEKVAADVSFNDQKILTARINAVNSGELSGEYTTEGKKEIDIEKLSDDSEESKYFMSDLQSGLGNIMSVLMQVVPDLMDMILPQQ